MVFQQDESKLVCLSFCKSLALASVLGQALWHQGGDGITSILLQLTLVLSQSPQLLPLPPPCISHCSLKSSIYNRTRDIICIEY